MINTLTCHKRKGKSREETISEKKKNKKGYKGSAKEPERKESVPPHNSESEEVNAGDQPHLIGCLGTKNTKKGESRRGTDSKKKMSPVGLEGENKTEAGGQYAKNVLEGTGGGALWGMTRLNEKGDVKTDKGPGAAGS